MQAAATLSEAYFLPEVFHVLNHFHDMHLRIVSSVPLIEVFDLLFFML